MVFCFRITEAVVVRCRMVLRLVVVLLVATMPVVTTIRRCRESVVPRLIWRVLRLVLLPELLRDGGHDCLEYITCLTSVREKGKGNRRTKLSLAMVAWEGESYVFECSSAKYLVSLRASYTTARCEQRRLVVSHRENRTNVTSA